MTQGKRPYTSVLVDGATHIQTYWVKEYIDQIVNKLTAFYGKNL